MWLWPLTSVSGDPSRTCSSSWQSHSRGRGPSPASGPGCSWPGTSRCPPWWPELAERTPGSECGSPSLPHSDGGGEILETRRNSNCFLQLNIMNSVHLQQSLLPVVQFCPRPALVLQLHPLQDGTVKMSASLLLETDTRPHSAPSNTVTTTKRQVHYQFIWHLYT